ncbi:MAG TPA: hypothetical protein VJV79_19015 [Polyangiaceae bacterium]|nr:hypothetical protein [Polyangiaceae bacterium]
MKTFPVLISRAAIVTLALSAAACGDNQTSTPSATEALYAFVSQVSTPDGSTTYVALTDKVPEKELGLDSALEVPGYGDIVAFDDKLYISDGENFRISKNRADGNRLVEEDSISFKDRGISFLSQPLFVDSEHAYLVNGDQYTVIEWNPQTMRIVAEHDISGLKLEGWGSEYRNGFARATDGKLFLQWAYNNKREEFLNDFVVGVFDTRTKSLNVLKDDICSSSAAFGGFFDEAGDLYLIADSFGGFTFFGNAEPKSDCVLRIEHGKSDLDPDFRFVPSQAMGGLAPWGLYYAGNGRAYTTAVDPAGLANYGSVFEFIFAPIHEGYTLDLRDMTARKVGNMPPDAVGFKSVTVDGAALIPRSTAAAEVYEVDDIRTTVYTLNDDGSQATERFKMPGYLGSATRLR